MLAGSLLKIGATETILLDFTMSFSEQTEDDEPELAKFGAFLRLASASFQCPSPCKQYCTSSESLQSIKPYGCSAKYVLGALAPFTEPFPRLCVRVSQRMDAVNAEHDDRRISIVPKKFV
jgi:hypothetical protein